MTSLALFVFFGLISGVFCLFSFFLYPAAHVYTQVFIMDLFSLSLSHVNKPPTTQQLLYMSVQLSTLLSFWISFTRHNVYHFFFFFLSSISALGFSSWFLDEIIYIVSSSRSFASC